MPERTKKRSYRYVIEPILIDKWRNLYYEATPKWNRTSNSNPGIEGKCDAKITLTDGTIIEGKYKNNSYHAEMDALVKVLKLDDIKMIEITSPPCPRCAVVLEILNLSTKVFCKEALSRCSISENWDRKKAVDLVNIVARFLDDDERMSYINEIYNSFQNPQGWCYKLG